MATLNERVKRLLVTGGEEVDLGGRRIRLATTTQSEGGFAERLGLHCIGLRIDTNNLEGELGHRTVAVEYHFPFGVVERPIHRVALQKVSASDSDVNV